MPAGKRVVFTFDERSLQSLEEIKERGRFRTLADTVRRSLQVNRALQAQAEQGFREIVVRNPQTNDERVLVIPDLLPEER